jgi:hypothetical protein
MDWDILAGMTAHAGDRAPVRIGNSSGFLGDRLSAAAELVDSGEIDVLTGDWLAELTMLILARQRMKHGAGSWTRRGARMPWGSWPGASGFPRGSGS